MSTQRPNAGLLAAETAKPFDPEPSPLPDVAADIEQIDKIERASSVATSMDLTVSDQHQRDLGHRISPLAANQISLDDVEAVDVQVRDLSIIVDTSPSILDPSTYPALFREKFDRKTQDGVQPRSKTLIHSVNANFKPGSLTAILGGSGSGKTTLLNMMAERITSSRLSKTGTAHFNGSPGVHSVRHAYVMQQDILLPTLTVQETLRYSADLRLPSSMSTEDRYRIVEEVILELGLKECANTRIGNSQHRGCSGGEKRRVSIGVQLLANPSVLFLDEPTTGLDAMSAFQLVRTLHTLASKGRTIITTIHQPRSEIWDLFDGLVLLSRGSPVYSGPANECLPWFESAGFALPPFVNPAEFVIDLSAVDNRTPELEEFSTARVDRLKAIWGDEAQKRFSATTSEKVAVNRGFRSRLIQQHASFAQQVRVLTDRTLKVTVRDPMGMSTALLEAALMGMVAGYIFYDLGRDQAGIKSREACLYISSALQGYLWLSFEVYRLTNDIPTFDREHSEGCSDVLPFMISRRLARFPTEDFPVPFLFSVIAYFMMGLDRTPQKFFTFFSIVFVTQYIAVTCALTCVTAARNFPGASLIGNLVYTLESSACGFFVQQDTIPVYTRWLKWIAYQYYVLAALMGNEFNDSFYDCPYDGGESSPACASYTGAYVLNAFGYPQHWIWQPILIMVSFIVFFSVLTWVGLTFIPVEMTISRARDSQADHSAGKEKMTARSIGAVRAIDVGLEKFGLKLDKRSPYGQKLPVKTILNPINATFQAGVLNIIMGPSGSGKTSLLNAMALRLTNTVNTRYRPSGKLTFNGAEPSESVIRSVCSYVCQDDDALLPSLTVRETLRFAAALRLPSFMSTEEKHQRAEEVLLKMGLKDCADNLVGNDVVKGISGGEKRRVTVAVQVLTDPRVLLLDEPTSGLDAFTASSIMEVLHGLAQEGRTLILTIHQARSDLFKHFGNVLLLAGGGSPGYAGPAKEMLGYFKGHGFDCPTHTNPADFALDLITIDLQQEQREAETREKVRILIEAWGREIGKAKTGPNDPGISRLPDIVEEPSTSEAIDPKEDAMDVEPAAPLERRPSFIPPPRKSLNKSKLATPAELGAMVRKHASFGQAVPTLLHRAFINFRRQPDLLLARIMQAVGFGIVLALFMAPVRNEYSYAQTRIGLIQQIGALYFIGMLQNVAVYPAERDVFYRESDDGVYGAEVFLAVYTLLEVPAEIVSALLFGLFAVFAIGIPRTALMYFVASFTCFGIVSCGESLGIMFNTLFASHTGFAVNLTSIFLSVAQVMGGLMSIDMPALFVWFNYISPIRYATRAFAPFSLDGVVFTCDDAQKLPDGTCVVATGEQLLELYGLTESGVVNIGGLAACLVVYRIVAWGLLRLVRTRWRGERRRKVQKGE